MAIAQHAIPEGANSRPTVGVEITGPQRHDRISTRGEGAIDHGRFLNIC